MSFLYQVNYFIFSVFLTLFLLEVGFSLLSLFYYSDYKDKFRRIINPIWEVTGTFGVFYLVNFEVTYPKILPIIGNAYIIPLTVAAAFIIFRNMFLVFGDKLGDPVSEKRFTLVYAASTLIVAILVVSTLTSGISGIGISTASSTSSIGMFLNVYNLAMLVSIILISLFLVNSVLNVDRLHKLSPVFLLCGLVVAIAASYLYLPGLQHSLQNWYYAIISAAILVAVSIILHYRRSVYSIPVGLISILIAINIFGLLQYPYVFGDVNINTYLVSSAIAAPEIAITIIGGGIVTLSLAALIYLNYSRSSKN